MTRISFIVLCHNSARVVERCVMSLIDQGAPGRDEVWIVENGSIDGSREIVQKLELRFPESIRVIYMERNHGTTVSRNHAIRRASGRYIAIVDSDVEVPRGMVDDLLKTLDAVPRRGLAAPRLLYRDGRVQLSADRFPTLVHKVRRYLWLRRMERDLNAALPMPGVYDVDYAISAFWLIKREVVETVGMLDERIFYAPEDVDYCLRVWQSGYSCVQDSTVHAIHDAQEISRVAPWRPSAISHMKGLVYFFAKHRYLFSTRRARDLIRAAHTNSASHAVIH